MGVRRNIKRRGYGLNRAIFNAFPEPIVSNRAPSTNDIAEVGSLWIDQSGDTAYVLIEVAAGQALWQTSPSGGTSATSFTVNPGNLTVTAGDIIVTAGDVTLSAGTLNASALNITGAVTFSGITSSGDNTLDGGDQVIEGSNDTTETVYILANAGTSETIHIHSIQGTAANSVDIESDAGGITLSSGLASDDAINLIAGAGGIDIDGALQVNITSSENAADAVVLQASAGGIDILASGASAGEDIDIIATGSSVNLSSTENAAGALTFTANGGTSETIVMTSAQGTGAGSIELTSTAGGITLTGGLATADAVNIVAANAAGGVDLDAGTGGIIADTTGAISLDAEAASNFTTSGAGIDLTLSSAAGSVIVDGGEAAATAVQIAASNGAGGVSVTAGTGGITLSASGQVSVVEATDTQASPTAAATINAFVGHIQFTGFTIASSGVQQFTITNSLVDTSSAILVTLQNEGANDAQMTVTRVERAAGSFVVTATNNGAAALNGNIGLTFWVLS